MSGNFSKKRVPRTAKKPFFGSCGENRWKRKIPFQIDSRPIMHLTFVMSICYRKNPDERLDAIPDISCADSMAWSGVFADLASDFRSSRPNLAHHWTLFWLRFYWRHLLKQSWIPNMFS
jgi:hypothetical protein